MVVEFMRRPCRSRNAHDSEDFILSAHRLLKTQRPTLFVELYRTSLKTNAFGKGTTLGPDMPTPPRLDQSSVVALCLLSHADSTLHVGASVSFEW